MPDLAGVEIQVMSVADLEPAPYNPRTISEAALAGLRSSIDRFGLVQPIVWNKRSGHVVSGHQRLQILEAQHIGKTPVVVVDLDEGEEKALNIAQNNPHIAGEFTEDLGTLLDEMKGEMPGYFEALRFDILEQDVPEPEPPEPTEQDDVVPEPPKEAVTKPGDLWLLGKHRVLCGDSTKAADVERLMRGETYPALVTSPPYPGVGVWEDIWPNMSIEECHEWLKGLYRTWLPFAGAACNWIVNMGDNTSNQWNDWWSLKMCEDIGLRFIQRAIWHRTGWTPCGMSRRRLLQVHEWVLWFTPTKEFTRPWAEACGDRLASTVFTVPWDRERLHVTPFPVQVVQDWLTIWSNPAELVVDPFLGSGTTLIAAEKLGRVCYGMEIEPRYCDVIVKRWEEFTGGKAKVKHGKEAHKADN